VQQESVPCNGEDDFFYKYSLRKTIILYDGRNGAGSKRKGITELIRSPTPMVVALATGTGAIASDTGTDLAMRLMPKPFT
jgi:hypothetical protein